MSRLSEDIVELVDTLVRPLVDNPDALELTSSEEAGTVLVEISVDESDAGKVIGRQGRVIKAVRTLTRAAASRSVAHVEVELVE